MELLLGNDPEGVANLESAVLVALSKLSRGSSKSSQKTKRNIGVSCKCIAEFVKATYSWIDGDIESQVMTALLSCIKTGLVCALVNGRYRLIGPTAKAMANNCIVRPSHGPRCCCLNMLKCFSKSFSQVCCVLETKNSEIKKRRLCLGKKNSVEPTTPLSQKARKRDCKARVHCMRVKRRNKKDKGLSVRFCPVTRKSLCMTCYPVGDSEVVPHHSFSPREENSAPPCRRT